MTSKITKIWGDWQTSDWPKIEEDFDSLWIDINKAIDNEDDAKEYFEFMLEMDEPEVDEQGNYICETPPWLKTKRSRIEPKQIKEGTESDEESKTSTKERHFMMSDTGYDEM